MHLKTFLIIIFFVLSIIQIHAETYRTSVSNIEYGKHIGFQIHIPNTSLQIKVNITMQLETMNLTTTTTTTTESNYYRMPANYESEYYQQNDLRNPREQRHFTVAEAIEAFRKNLVEKELRIGGIYESSGVFYRHFNLVYDTGEIRIKCSYYSRYEERTLNIYCFQYADYDNYDDYIDNDENLEALHERKNYKTTPKITDVNAYYQTLHMRAQ